ncbi:MAG: Dicer-like protein 1 [Thelocarpon impressellum]|nr:MAG: Dicer-like protein 1 [Thelocarpon impressellum]
MEEHGTDSEPEKELSATVEQRESDRRRVQSAKFKSWFSKRAEKIVTEESDTSQKILDDDVQSTRYLMQRQESNVIINDPREYQLELFERAKDQNVIAVLDTGSGKTLISVLLLKHTLDQELENRGLGKPLRTSFFLVDSVTLVFQQFAVLECNLDQKIDRFCGEMGCDLWNKETWDKLFAENMVVVCTAEVLYQCLMHSFISMDRINLLIFDEAHHAKKNHPYAKIIKDFYIAAVDAGTCPKIFGMTASPVDAKVDVVRAAKELETLLHCQIATASDLTLLQRAVHRPAEQIVSYDRLVKPYNTPLTQKLEALVGNLEILSKSFYFAQVASSELGPWCVDRMWYSTFGPDEDRKLERKLERDFLAINRQLEAMTVLDEDQARLEQAREVVRAHTFGDPSPSLHDLSSKVLLLQDYLKQRFERPTDDRCIVFVQRRSTARLLEDLFSRPNIGTPNLRVGLLVGARKGEVNDISVTFRYQVLMLTRFRKGLINCLFATSIAEEGLDIPDCNLIVRFDLYTTMIQYIQSRGRARHANSKYVHMVEKDNAAHHETLREVRKGEGVMRRFCESLPADRHLQGNDCDLENALVKERGFRVYTEPETGAKLTYGSSLAVLAHFVGRLPHDAETTLQAHYVVLRREGRFFCEVILPENSPIRSAVGRPVSRRSIAKRSAAFEACLMLRKAGHLDKHLLPTYQKKLPAMRNALLALNMKKASIYDVRTKPAFWAESVGHEPVELFLTIFELEKPDGLGRQYQPLALLTRSRLAQMPEFPIHFLTGATSLIISTRIASSLAATDEKMVMINTFTLRIFQELFNKTYESDLQAMPYWLAPISPQWSESRGRDPKDVIDWDTLAFVHENECLEWKAGTPDEFWKGRFIVDPLSGGTRYFAVAVAPNLTPLDPVPADAPKRKFMDNILQYSVSFWRKAREKATWRLDQPVVAAHMVMHRLNWLDAVTEKERCAPTECYIYPEPLKVSALPPGIAAMGYVFPAIMFRLDSYLIALELCDKLNLDVKTEYALEAITKDSDNTEDHRNEQIHFQRGMGRNYERLEFLGDCFLKMATSISLYTLNPDNDEFEYHVKRMLLICNKNLLNTAVKRKLYEYIRSTGFQRRVWYPEEPKLLHGKAVNQGMRKHSLGDKSLADVCEAIIGAALLSHHETGNFDNAVRAVTELVSSKDHDMKTWNDYYKLYRKPAFQIANATKSQLDLAEQMERKDSYRFRHPRLLRSAFAHPSYPSSWENIPCYQRLEFLGDSLLDMACVNHLYHRYPDRDPQWLTEHKMAMVSNKFLGALCVKLGFHKHLRSNGAMVEYQVREYVTEIEEAERLGDGSPDYWVSAKGPPKALPDIVEAYIGALFVDSEFDYKQVERFFEEHIKVFFADMTIYDTFANSHPTTWLNNILTTNLGCTNFRILAEEIPALDAALAPQILAAVMVHDDIIAEGRAASDRHARIKASEAALDVLKGLSPAEFRRQYGCDCKEEIAGGAQERPGEGAGVAAHADTSM